MRYVVLTRRSCSDSSPVSGLPRDKVSGWVRQFPFCLSVNGCARFGSICSAGIAGLPVTMLLVTLSALWNIDEKSGDENGKGIDISNISTRSTKYYLPGAAAEASPVSTAVRQVGEIFLPISTFSGTTYHCLALAELLCSCRKIEPASSFLV